MMKILIVSNKGFFSMTYLPCLALTSSLVSNVPRQRLVKYPKITSQQKKEVVTSKTIGDIFDVSLKLSSSEQISDNWQACQQRFKHENKIVVVRKNYHEAWLAIQDYYEIPHKDRWGDRVPQYDIYMPEHITDPQIISCSNIQLTHPLLARGILAVELADDHCNFCHHFELPRVDFGFAKRQESVVINNYNVVFEASVEIFVRVYQPVKTSLAKWRRVNKGKSVQNETLNHDVPILAQRFFLEKGELFCNNCLDGFAQTAKERGAVGFLREKEGIFRPMEYFIK